MPPQSVMDRILRFNAGRDPERLGRKLAIMRAGPFPFFRGTAHLFYGYDKLLRPLADAPGVWSCGDLHLENFGCYKGDNRLAYFDINDFDEAALAPLTWDLVRLLTSLQLGLTALKRPGREQRAMCRHLVGEYAAVLQSGKPRWIERATAEGPVRRLIRQAKLRTRRQLLAERSEWTRGRTRRRLRMREGRTLPVTRIEHRQVAAAIARVHVPGVNPRFFRALDVARRVAGTASLGLPRYSILIEGRSAPDNHYLLDLKGAASSALAAASALRQPAWRSEAERVVSVQQWVQAVSPALLTTARLGRTSFIVRELQPTEDRLKLADWNTGRGAMETLLASVAQVTAWGHLRAAGREGAASVDQLTDFGGRRSWRHAVLRSADAAAAGVEADWQAFAAEFDRRAARE